MSNLKSLPPTRALIALKEAWDAVPDQGQIPAGVGVWLQPLLNAVTEIVNPTTPPPNDGFARVLLTSDGTPIGTQVSVDGRPLSVTKFTIDVDANSQQPAKVTIELYGGDVDIHLTGDYRLDGRAGVAIEKNIAMRDPT